jgi:Secretion system C-terminal sorting domain
MKNPLLFIRLAHAIFLSCIIPNLSGQTVVFSEDFSGFTAGSHSSQASYDYSQVLDTKTINPGWTGFKIYSAGGEIKLGISNVPGWIETPEINLSGYEGDLFVKFDISQWPDDEASVRVLLNGSQIGITISPGNEFQTIEIPVEDGVASGKIRFESMAKRFFLDNVQVISQNPTGSVDSEIQKPGVNIYPNPAGDIVNIDNLSAYEKLEIYSLDGKIVLETDLSGTARVTIALNSMPSGIYILRFVSVGSVRKIRLIKY